MKQTGQIMTVAGFTFREAVRKKAFWITNIIYIVLVLGACLILPRVGGGLGGELSGDLSSLDLSQGIYGQTCYFLDESGNPLLDGAADMLTGVGFNVEKITAGELDACLEKINDSKDAAVVHLSSSAELPEAVVYTKSLMSRFPAQAVGDVLNFVYRSNSFTAAGYDEDTSQGILASGLAVTNTTLQNFSNYFAGLALMLVMFMTIYVYGYGVAMSVATEKSTRVMETLIVSAKPSRILVGKCIGMGAVGLAQLAGVLCFSGFCGKVLVPGGSLGPGLQLPDLTVTKALLLVVYFLLGYALFSMINSMCGAMVSKMEDLQSAMMPAALISVISFYGGGYAPMISGGGVAGRAMMLIPFTAPYAASSVLLSGEYDMRLIAMSIGILLATIVVVSWISGKVYSASVLHYGSRLRFGDVRKMIRGK